MKKLLIQMLLWILRLLGHEIAWSNLWQLKHHKCCKIAADKALAETDWTGSRFNRALENAYGQSRNLGCGLSGFRLRFMLYYYVLQELERRGFHFFGAGGHHRYKENG